MRCGDCKHWGIMAPQPSGHEPSIQTGKWRQCGAVPHDERGSCDEDDAEIIKNNDWDPKWDRSELNAPIRKSLAVVKDGSGYYAALKCQADFGCVLFKPKETT